MHDGPVLIGGSPERPGGPDSTEPAPDVRMTLPANAQNVVLVRHVLTCLAESLDLPKRLVEDIRLAVTEACTNVVRHAYSGSHGQLEVRITRDQPGALTVTVSDHGAGLRPRVDLDGPGLGLPLMGALAHALEIEQAQGEGSRVRMRFELTAG